MLRPSLTFLALGVDATIAHDGLTLVLGRDGG
jgi:hypothetical protein